MFELEAELDLRGLEQGFRRARETLSADVASAVNTAIQEGAGEALRVRSYKDQTGRLTRSIRAYMTEVTDVSATGTIVALMPYAKFVEEGTAPHEIVAKNAVALRWEDPGGVHFARVVHHPGTKPYPFMGPAYLKAERVLEREVTVIFQNMAAAFDG